MPGTYQTGKPALKLFVIGVTLVISVLTVVFMPGMTLAMSSHKDDLRLGSCPEAGTITDQSLLIVLLDRSGSLVIQPGATDPDGYSTSVTKAFADLWPGSMAVIPFSNYSTPVLGPAALSDQGQRDKLKNAIQNYPIGGDTPLAPALHQALGLIKGASSGSRIVIVTDGSPYPPVINGVNQADDVRTALIPQFCAQGRPISTFGLALDLSQPDGQEADQLLQDIALGTDGTYVNVRNAQDLAQVVTRLYAAWQHLIFLKTSAINGTYTVPIDTYAQKAIFVTFRTDSKFRVTLNGPDGPIPTQAVQRSTDRHYEIDSLILSGVNQPGSYAINVEGDNGAQVYTLVESPLHVVLDKPTPQTVAYIGQPLQIAAELYNGSTPIIPQPDEATVNAHVSVLVKGQAVFSQDVELVQGKNSSVFARQIALPGPVGQVKIELQAVYHHIPVEAADAQVVIPLLARQISRAQSPSVLPCGLNLKCYWQHSPAQTVAAPVLLLLLLLFVAWLLTQGPHGILVQGSHKEDLGRLRRPLWQALLHKSVLSSQELENYGDFQFGGAKFDLHFGRRVSVRTKNDTPRIVIKQDKNIQDVKREEKDGVQLFEGGIILVGTSTPATYLEEALDDDAPYTEK